MKLIGFSVGVPRENDSMIIFLSILKLLSLAISFSKWKEKCS